MPPRPASAHDAMAIMQQLLAPNAALFAQIGGEVLFFIKAPPTGTDALYTITADRNHVWIEERAAPNAVLKIGISERILLDLLEGTLDAETALANNQLRLEGDLRRWDVFAKCLSPPKSALGLRAQR